MVAASGRERDEARFVLEDFEPAYLNAWRGGLLDERVRAARAELAECRACPRDCGVDRLAGETGVCRTGRRAIVRSALPHTGEEDCLRGRRGSGTIFFGLCNLRCVFCQNWDISQQRAGHECTADEIAELMLELQAAGCHNVNLVTPEHVAPQVIEAIAAAVPRGLSVPVVYNTSAYDSLSTLRLLDGLVDVYMPDFKFWSRDSARRLCKAADYPARAREAIREMHRQVGPLRLGPDGVARRGVLVRHLVMPGGSGETAAIFDWLAREISRDTYVNVMGQYHPEHEVGTPAGPETLTGNGGPRYAEIDRRPTQGEIEAAYAAARRAGLWRLDARRSPW